MDPTRRKIVKALGLAAFAPRTVLAYLATADRDGAITHDSLARKSIEHHTSQNDTQTKRELLQESLVERLIGGVTVGDERPYDPDAVQRQWDNALGLYIACEEGRAFGVLGNILRQLQDAGIPPGIDRAAYNAECAQNPLEDLLRNGLPDTPQASTITELFARAQETARSYSGTNAEVAARAVPQGIVYGSKLFEVWENEVTARLRTLLEERIQIVGVRPLYRSRREQREWLDLNEQNLRSRGGERLGHSGRVIAFENNPIITGLRPDSGYFVISYRGVQVEITQDGIRRIDRDSAIAESIRQHFTHVTITRIRDSPSGGRVDLTYDGVETCAGFGPLFPLMDVVTIREMRPAGSLVSVTFGYHGREIELQGGTWS